MKRKIPLKNNGQYWVLVSIMAISYAIVSIAISLVSKTDLELLPFVISIITMAVVYAISARYNRGALSIEGEDVLLNGITAKLLLKKSLFGRDYIQATSLTKSGYHRVNFDNRQVSLVDWDLLLKKCI